MLHKGQRWPPHLRSNTACPCSPYLCFLTMSKCPSLLPPAADPLPARRDVTHISIKRDREEDFFKMLSVSQSSPHCPQTDPRVPADIGSQVSHSTILTRAVAGSPPPSAQGLSSTGGHRVQPQQLNQEHLHHSRKGHSTLQTEPCRESTNSIQWMSWESSQLPYSADSR